MRHRSPFFLVAALLLGAGFQFSAAMPAQAHGEAKARFGGIVKAAQEISFELVSAAPGGAQVYMDDHGELMSTTGITGKMTVIGKSGGKKEAVLTTDGKKLSAAGATPVSGDRVILVVVLPTAQTISVRYAIP
ncbi:hypothetical protein [Pseudoxanthomonas yeongjuensis]|jgi:hypothetical protein|uniref:hypothetical protein n=1 Tax=Pseudoxanthomonas yeongjuensis TaxID=377616 RepID=UPI0013917CA5|nr:hypothetical protein [Pseudoxanthomonas yeongjuensis]